MFARIYSVLFMLASFALFASASPVPHHELTARDNALAARCGCGNDLVEVLADLQVKVDAAVTHLDGKANPSAPIADIVAALHVAADVAANIDISTPFTTAEINLCVSAIVNIVIAILVAVSKYGLLAVLTLCAQLDAALSLCIKACISVCADLSAGIYAGLQVHVKVLATLKLVLTIATCGL